MLTKKTSGDILPPQKQCSDWVRGVMCHKENSTGFILKISSTHWEMFAKKTGKPPKRLAHL